LAGIKIFSKTQNGGAVEGISHASTWTSCWVSLNFFKKWDLNLL